MSILFKNALVLLNGNGDKQILKNAYLGVTEQIISYIGIDPPEEKYDTVRDMSGHILMPGLYNCHTHSPMVLLRGVGSDLPLDKWLFGEVCPIEDKLTPEYIRVGSDLALLEMIAGGTVSFSDMYFEPAQTAQAVASAGIRANLCRPVQCFDPDEKPGNSYRIREAIALYDEYNGYADGRVLIDFCIHAEYTCTPGITKYLVDYCNEKKGNLHIHLSETEKEHNECLARYGKTPAEWFDSLGGFDSDCFAAHCVYLTDSDIRLFKDRGLSIVHNPTSNMKLASGFAPMTKFREVGLNVALGTDGAASNNNLDMFEEMHLAGVIHNGYEKDASVMDAAYVIDLATVNGAKVQRRPQCGCLKVGNKADIIAVSLDKPHMRPVVDPCALIVYSAGASDVDMTMCDGKILYDHGEFKTIDAEKVYFELDKVMEKLYR